MTNVHNSYPELAVIPYQHTSVDMQLVVDFAKTLISIYGLEPVRTTYCIFRNESGNGHDGVNNNYAGIQGDNARWEGLTGAIGTCVHMDGAGDTRRFICFDENGYKTSFEFVCKKVVQRNMFIGAAGINTSDDLAYAYLNKWVADPKEFTGEAIDNFKSLYHSATMVFI